MLAGNASAILGMLRLLMMQENLVAYIIPGGDAHQSEELRACDRRRAFVTGFTGSAGTAVVTQNVALLWTDSRYFIQAEDQLDPKFWMLMKEDGRGPTIAEWLREHFKKGDVVGVDPSLFSEGDWDALETELDLEGIKLRGVKRNLVDLIWGEDRPPEPHNPVVRQPLRFAGVTTPKKLKQVRQMMEEAGAKILVVSELDDVAWLLNLRGSDIPYTPVFVSYVIVKMDSFELFISKKQISRNIRRSLLRLQGSIYPYDGVTQRLDFHVKNNANGGIWISSLCNALIANTIPRDRRIVALTPIALIKAIKNEVEAQGMIAAHIRDGAAMAQWMAWLYHQFEIHPDGQDLTELSVAEKLDQYRAKQEYSRGLSFETISASGPNGAIVHYSATPATNRRLGRDDMLLIDSGGQYIDGTTDVTRTLHFGKPTEEMKDSFTRVLKGQIAVTTAIFPRYTLGSAVDSLARQFLWKKRLDFGHNTGHGIGAYLAVHEFPPHISRYPDPHDPGFDVNAFTSNEPGYYKEDEYGIRLENIVRVVNDTESPDFVTFEDVTLVPIQKSLIQLSLLTQDEISYIDEYHAKVWNKVGGYMREHNASRKSLQWLQRATQPLDQESRQEPGQEIASTTTNTTNCHFNSCPKKISNY